MRRIMREACRAKDEPARRYPRRNYDDNMLDVTGSYKGRVRCLLHVH